jgi:hypothetical protein
VRIELRIPTGDRALLDVARRGLAPFPLRQKQRSSGTWLYADVESSPTPLNLALSVLVALDIIILRRLLVHGIRVPLFGSGIRYQLEPPGREWWQTVYDNVKEREGDCEDLAAHRAADLNVYEGEPARATAIRTGSATYHAIVERANGVLDDPSAALGMRPLSKRARERAEVFP